MVERASSTSAAICIGILLLLGSDYKIRQVLNDKPASTHPSTVLLEGHHRKDCACQTAGKLAKAPWHLM